MMTRLVRKLLTVLFLLSLTTALAVGNGLAAELVETPVERLGRNIFFDSSLSTPPGQSCADCHVPATGWTGGDSAINAAGAVEPGIVPTRFGNRKPPTSAYAGFSPPLHQCDGMDCGGMGGGMGGMGGGGMGGGGMGGGGMGGGGMGGEGMGGEGMGGEGMGGGMMAPGTFVGGLFWDGRASGWTLGDPLAEQAMGPFLNPLEQNNPNPRMVCLNLLRSDYAPLFEEVWGAGSLDCVVDVAGTYERIARAVAAYERSAEANPFSAKFDLFWKNSAGLMPPVPAINAMNWSRFRNRGLDDGELKGLMLFNTKGNCSGCHRLQAMHGSPAPLFTDFSYHNLGIPGNPENPFYTMPPRWNRDGAAWVDTGLGGFLATTAGKTDLSGTSRDYSAAAAVNLGKHRTPTLRNVDLRPSADFVKAYGHNGYFKSLAEIVHFYNLRDVLPICAAGEPVGMNCFDPPEVAANVNRADLGNLQLTPEEGMAIIAFLKTLSDGFSPP